MGRADRVSVAEVVNTLAQVAKLADAPGLGPDDRKVVGVRVPSRAQKVLWTHRKIPYA